MQHLQRQFEEFFRTLRRLLMRIIYGSAFLFVSQLNPL